MTEQIIGCKDQLKYNSVFRLFQAIRVIWRGFVLLSFVSQFTKFWDKVDFFYIFYDNKAVACSKVVINNKSQKDWVSLTYSKVLRETWASYLVQAKNLC